MNETPMAVQTRPFAVEPVTSVMLPDGIFDNALYNLLISCHYTNTSSKVLTNVSIYFESIGDPGIIVTAQTYTFNSIPAGASVLVQWPGNFKFASPGKTPLSFIAKADGFTSSRSIKEIFVTETRYNKVAEKWVCTIPEGRLEVLNIYVINPGNEWDPEIELLYPGPYVPTGIKFSWYSNSSFDGQFSDLPFSDPWWKVIGLIVIVVSAIVGIIAASTGYGTFIVGVSGKYDDDPSHPNVQCCTPNMKGMSFENAATVAGVCTFICAAGIIAACSDEADPIYRGEKNTMPKAGELTVCETLDAHWTFVDPPNAGTPYRTKVEWNYKRITTGDTYEYNVNEEQTNIHVVDNVEVYTPVTFSTRSGYLWVQVKFKKPDGTLYRGADLYAFCFFLSPGSKALYFMAPLLDDGLELDAAANDGIYTAQLDLKRAIGQISEVDGEVEGVWRVYVFAQEVNRTTAGTPPIIAAQTIGGSFVSSSVSIKFDSTLPCPIKTQAYFKVTDKP